MKTVRVKARPKTYNGIEKIPEFVKDCDKYIMTMFDDGNLDFKVTIKVGNREYTDYIEAELYNNLMESLQRVYEVYNIE